MNEFPAAPRRAHCPRCLRPASRCLCTLARPVRHVTPVLVLQHPQEQRQAKNSVTLMRLSLSDCEVQVGERWTADALHTLLHRGDGRTPVLLYPDVPAAPAPSLWACGPTTPLRLVVIDATWRKSLRLLLEHPALAALPRLALDTPPPTRYRAIRSARREDQVSTLEATAHALAQLDGDAAELTPLLKAFDDFVARTAAERAQRPPGMP